MRASTLKLFMSKNKNKNVYAIIAISLYIIIDMFLFLDSPFLGDDAGASIARNLTNENNIEYGLNIRNEGSPFILYKTEDDFIPIMHQDRHGGIPFYLVKGISYLAGGVLSLFLFQFISKLLFLIIILKNKVLSEKNKTIVLFAAVTSPLFYFHYAPLLTEIIMLPISTLLYFCTYKFENKPKRLLLLSVLTGLLCIIIKATFIWYIFIIFLLRPIFFLKNAKTTILPTVVSLLPLLFLINYGGNLNNYSPELSFDFLDIFKAIIFQLNELFIYIFRPFSNIKDFFNSVPSTFKPIEYVYSISLLVSILVVRKSDYRKQFQYGLIFLIMFFIVRTMIIERHDDLYHYSSLAFFLALYINFNFIKKALKSHTLIKSLLLSILLIPLAITIFAKCKYNIHASINSKVLENIATELVKKNISKTAVFSPYIGKFNFISNGKISEASEFYRFKDNDSIVNYFNSSSYKAFIIYTSREYNRSRPFRLVEMESDGQDIDSALLKSEIEKYPNLEYKVYSLKYNPIVLLTKKMAK